MAANATQRNDYAVVVLAVVGLARLAWPFRFISCCLTQTQHTVSHAKWKQSREERKTCAVKGAALVGVSE